VHIVIQARARSWSKALVIDTGVFACFDNWVYDGTLKHNLANGNGKTRKGKNVWILDGH
jgi:hypothetical protein